MKKAVAIIVCGLVAWSATGSTPVSASSKKKEVYARYLLIDQDDWMTLWGLKEWDHTYYCENKSGKSEKCYSRTGRSEGGAKLSDTKSKQNDTNVKCVYDNAKKDGACDVKSYESNWLKRRGTCQQETNHGLRTGKKGGPTVSDAKGYWLTKLRFGAYGRDGLEEACKNKCND